MSSCKHDNVKWLPGGYGGCEDCGALLPDDFKESEKTLYVNAPHYKLGEIVERDGEQYMVIEQTGLARSNFATRKAWLAYKATQRQKK